MKTIVSSYSDDSNFGFGDFLRGSAAIRQYCIRNNINFQIDFSKHEVGKYVKSNYKGPEYQKIDIRNGRRLDVEDLKEKFNLQDYYFVCNNHAFGQFRSLIGIKNNELNKIDVLKDSEKNFFLNNLNFCDSLKNDAAKKLSERGVDNFKVFHARVGDEYSFSNGLGFASQRKRSNRTPFYVDTDQYLKIFIDLIKKNKDSNNVIISDSSDLKIKIDSFLRDNQISNSHVFSFSSVHTSKKMLESVFEKPKCDDLYETLLEMYLVSLSDEITSVTSYNMNSNFVNSIAMFFGMPIRNLKASKYFNSNV